MWDVLRDRVSRRICSLEREGVTEVGEKCVIMSYIIFTLHKRSAGL
jgi:hypothetical protein